MYACFYATTMGDHFRRRCRSWVTKAGWLVAAGGVYDAGEWQGFFAFPSILLFSLLLITLLDLSPTTSPFQPSAYAAKADQIPHDPHRSNSSL